MVAPSLALDTLVEVLIIGVGTYARQPLQSVCLFGCASLVASFLLFITFFPAALALTMEVSKSAEVPAEAFSGFSLHHLTSTFLAEEEDCKANPVTQNIKLVMSLGLGFVHAFNWVIKPVGGDFASMGSLLDSSRGVLQPAADRLPVISTDSHSLPQLFGLAVDQVRIATDCTCTFLCVYTVQATFGPGLNLALEIFFFFVLSGSATFSLCCADKSTKEDTVLSAVFSFACV